MEGAWEGSRSPPPGGDAFAPPSPAFIGRRPSTQMIDGGSDRKGQQMVPVAATVLPLMVLPHVVLVLLPLGLRAVFLPGGAAAGSGRGGVAEEGGVREGGSREG